MAAPPHRAAAPTPPGSRIAAWLRLLRLPNLLTVPGDPIAGYLLAAGTAAAVDARLVYLVLVALLFYAAGLIMNDVVDMATDRAERPDRPLASGRIDARVARTAAVACLVAGLALARAAGPASLLTALALAAAIALYNVLFKATALGPLAMGLCRGLSVLLGASLANVAAPLVLAAAVVSTMYVAALTLLARHEVAGLRPGASAWLPAAVVLLAMSAFLRLSPVTGPMEFRMVAVFFLAFAMSGLAAWRLAAGGRRAAPECIGLLISALIALQSAYAIASAAGNLSVLLALAILLMWPLNRLLARYVAAS